MNPLRSVQERTEPHKACRPRRFVLAAALLAVGVLLSVTAAGSMAWALIDVGSDGTDGTLSYTGTTPIDLSLAVTGSWNQPGDGRGVYDPDKWAVVFKYDSLYVMTGKTVTFTNHPSGAPVVWLVRRGARIDGTVRLDGQALQTAGTFAIGGPGGFRGGRSYLSTQSRGSAGLGPGGGGYSPSGGSYTSGNGSGGSYRTAGGGPQPGISYGNARVLPLVGGSGGSAWDGTNPTFWSGGGGGGGALLLAAGLTVYIAGGITARGGANFWYEGYVAGSGGGAGGGIRIVAESVSGTVAGISAAGGGTGNSGGFGAIRIEANSISVTGSSNPEYTSLIPLDNNTAVIWPPSDAPTVRVTTVAGQAIPADPRSGLSPPGDLSLNTTGQVEVLCEAANVPTTGWKVTVRVVLKSGDEFSADATLDGGNETLSTWRVMLPQALPASNLVVVQARAVKL